MLATKCWGMEKNGKVSWADKKPETTNLFNFFCSSCVFKFSNTGVMNCHTRLNCRRCYWWYTFWQEDLALDKALGTSTFLLDVPVDDALRRDHNAVAGVPFSAPDQPGCLLSGESAQLFPDKKCFPPVLSYHIPSAPRSAQPLRNAATLQLTNTKPGLCCSCSFATVKPSLKWRLPRDYLGN